MSTLISTIMAIYQDEPDLLLAKDRGFFEDLRFLNPGRFLALEPCQFLILDSRDDVGVCVPAGDVRLAGTPLNALLMNHGMYDGSPDRFIAEHGKGRPERFRGRIVVKDGLPIITGTSHETFRDVRKLAVLTYPPWEYDPAIYLAQGKSAWADFPVMRTIKKPEITVLDPNPVRALALKDQADAAWPHVEQDLARLPTTLPAYVIRALINVTWSFYTCNRLVPFVFLEIEDGTCAFVPMADDYRSRDMARFMWQVAQQHKAHSVYFAYESTKDNMVVLCMTTDVLHKLTAPITKDGLGEWVIETHQAQ